MPLDEDHLRCWIGRSEVVADTIDLRRARLMQATLDREPDLCDGDPLPPLWHWLYFTEVIPQSGLGRDGHAKRGGFLPPVDLPHRMWAGGRLSFAAPLRLGQASTRRSQIADVKVKQGRSGTLCFVTVRHEIVGEHGEACLTEEQDIVYREDPAPDATRPEPPSAPQGAKRSEVVVPEPVMLFRYSALTFNGHRIHYDRDYCRDVEGYPGLVFHGPLTATLLAAMAQQERDGRPLATFTYRAVSPLFDTNSFRICVKPGDDQGLELWAETPGSRLAMSATATSS
jgi:3-methylfumaryl-CoA hydratase